jgi:hypothetical protein
MGHNKDCPISFKSLPKEALFLWLFVASFKIKIKVTVYKPVAMFDARFIGQTDLFRSEPSQGITIGLMVIFYSNGEPVELLALTG